MRVKKQKNKEDSHIVLFWEPFPTMGDIIKNNLNIREMIPKGIVVSHPQSGIEINFNLSMYFIATFDNKRGMASLHNLIIRKISPLLEVIGFTSKEYHIHKKVLI